MPKLKQAWLWSFGLTKTFAQSASPSRFFPKTQPPQRKKPKKNCPLHGCCPLLLGGGVWGGREKYGPNLFYLFGQALFAIATTPSYGHPSSPEEGTTLDAFLCFFQKLICVTRGGLVTLRAPSPFGEGWGEARMFVCFVCLFRGSLPLREGLGVGSLSFRLVQLFPSKSLCFEFFVVTLQTVN